VFAAALPGATVVDVLVMMIVDIVYIESFTSIAMMISILWKLRDVAIIFAIWLLQRHIMIAYRV